MIRVASYSLAALGITAALAVIPAYSSDLDLPVQRPVPIEQRDPRAITVRVFDGIGGSRTIVSTPPRRDPDPVDVGDPPVTFYGETLRGRRVGYVVDVSDSMNTWAVYPTTKRIDRARVEFAGSVLGLQPDQQFAVVLFNDSVKLLWPTPQQASPGAKNSAIGWVNGVPATGGTQTGAAISTCLRLYRPDMVVLLTDGPPSWDQRVNDENLAAIRRYNVDHVPINVFAIRPDLVQGMAPFCRTIASDSGGTYYEVR